MSELTAFNDDLMQFIQRAPTPFHAVAAMARRLQDAGFQKLEETEAWSLQPGGRYFVTRNDASLIAFVHGRRAPVDGGWRIIGAHTDSPCLKVKPEPDISNKGYYQLGVEVYGGVLLNPWFDRDLSLAGRISFVDDDGALQSALLDFQRPVATVPSLAIHLDREANESRSINAQKHLPPVMMPLAGDDKPSFRALLRQSIESGKAQFTPLSSGADAGRVAQVLDYELSFYDYQPPATIGWENDFIASARLDNLLSCYVGLQALCTASGDVSAVLVCNDHEEVGSQSASGAQGPMLKAVLQRMAGQGADYERAVQQSMLISADNAHGVHPNYADRHDDNHGPLLNAGPVIKVNANQRYASNSETSALFRHLCARQSVPVQSFVTRTDMGCGSTIGPLTAAEIGVKTLDVGVPTFGMHSIRELAGAKDAWYLHQVLAAFCALERV